MNKILLLADKIEKMLGGRVIATLAGAMVLSIMAVVFTDSKIVALGQQVEQISKIRENISTINALRTNLFRAESAQRGYILTHRDLYVAPFGDAIAGARANIEKINELLAEEPSQLIKKSDNEWLKLVGASLESKVAEMELTVTLSKAGKFKEANEIVAADQGLSAMNKFMQNTQVLLDQRADLLNELLKQRKTSIAVVRALVVGSALVLLLLVVGVIRQLINEMASREQLRDQLAKDVVKYERQIKNNSQELKILALQYQQDVERERQKLSRELHDELGSILTATKMDISWVMRKFKETAPEIGEKLSKTMRYLDQGIQFKRQIVQDLHPSMITTFGFWQALKSLIDENGERNQWTMNVILPDENISLGETIGLIAYRVVQETLNNASKYAKATKVSVHLMIELDYLKLEIEDNGIGVDLNNIDTTRHGLTGMRHRLLAIGGHLDIASTPGQGMLTRAMIPLDLKSES